MKDSAFDNRLQEASGTAKKLENLTREVASLKTKLSLANSQNYKLQAENEELKLELSQLKSDD